MSNKKTDAAPEQAAAKTPEKKEPARRLTLPQKLLAIQTAVDKIVKDGKNLSDKYDFASDENVLDRFRPLMDEHRLLLIPEMVTARVSEGATRSGTTRYFTEVTFNMIWLDADTGEKLSVPWYAQGVDLAGEKGVGKAATYAEKYFLLKFFHVATRKDDPDADRRTASGELRQRGTAAAKETEQYMRAAVTAMLAELYSGDETKIRAAMLTMTKAPSRGYDGVEELSAVSAAALGVVYGKVKKTYEQRTGHAYVPAEAAEGAQ